MTENINLEMMRTLKSLTRRVERLESVEVPRIGPAVLVFNNANVAWATGVWASNLSFNSEVSDDAGMHDPSVNPDRLTAVVAGWYWFYAQIQWAANGTGLRVLSVNRNGTLTEGQWTVNEFVPSASVACAQLVSGMVWLNVGDYLRIRPYQTSGGNLNLVYSANYSPYFGMVRVA